MRAVKIIDRKCVDSGERRASGRDRVLLPARHLLECLWFNLCSLVSIVSGLIVLAPPGLFFGVQVPGLGVRL